MATKRHIHCAVINSEALIPGPRFFPGAKIKSLGLHTHCENSSFFASRIHHFLKRNNYVFCDDIQASDVVLINTCTTTDELVSLMAQGINSLIEQNLAKKERVFIVLGCFRPFSDAVGRKWQRLKDRLYFVDLFNLERMDDLFLHTYPIKSFTPNNLALFDKYQPAIDNDDCFVLISTGCAFNCSYCNIKLAKGGVQSRPIAEIASEIRALSERGVREFVLLSDDCGSYGLDIGTDLTVLLDVLAKADEGLKFKIYNAHPFMFLRHWKRLEKHFARGAITYLCLPLQSGSQRLLGMMKRDYSLEKIRALLLRIREISPSTHLFSHFMLNFPTETREDFAASMEYARMFDAALYIPFGSNERAPASRFRPQGTAEELDWKRVFIADLIKQGELSGPLL